MENASVNQNQTMTAWDFLREISGKCCGFFSTEKLGKRASYGELRRWLQNRSVRINGVLPDFRDNITFPVLDMVLFPKSANRKNTLADKLHPFLIVEQS
jgi:hypothetical protein